MKSARLKKYITDEPCTVCGAHTEDGNALHHVKSRGAFGSDHPRNLMPLCDFHHKEIHRGVITFTKKYQAARAWLVVRDWCICELTGKWFHPLENQASNETDDMLEDQEI